jgi:hypothetical protein
MRLSSARSRFALASRVVIADHLARGTLDVQSQGILFAYGRLHLDTKIRAHARVHDWRWETGALALDDASLDVDRTTVSEDGSPREALSLARIRVTAHSARFDLSDPLAGISLSASFDGGVVHDTSALGAFLPEEAAAKVEADEGSFGAEVDVDVVRHVATGKVQARASRMGMRSKNLHLVGNLALFADVNDWDLERNRMVLRDSRLEVTGVAGRFKPEGGPQFSARRVAMQARSSAFSLEKPTYRGADVRVVVEQGEVPDGRAFDALLAPGGPLAIESGAARVTADVSVSATQHSASGGVDVTLSHGGIRLNETRFSGDFHLFAGVRDFDPDRSILDLSGVRFDMRDVEVRGASATTAAWNGNVSVSRASLRLDPELRFAGAVFLDARDARPLLAMLFGSGFPKILVRLTDMPHLVASAWLSVGKGRLALLDINAGGGDVGLRGSYAIRGRRRRGAVIARKAFLRVGLRLDDDGTHLRLFGLDGWLHNQTREVVKVLGAPDGT